MGDGAIQMERPRVTFEPGTVQHAIALAQTLRAEDREEVAAYGMMPLQCLAYSVQASDYCVAILLDGQVAALGGIKVGTGEGFLEGPVGQAWMLTGEACDRWPKAFVKAARYVLPGLQKHAGCPEVRNWVDARYTGAIRLLETMGFEILAKQPYGPNQLPFVLVSRRI